MHVVKEYRADRDLWDTLDSRAGQFSRKHRDLWDLLYRLDRAVFVMHHDGSVLLHVSPHHVPGTRQ